jgi:hypothetical protein
MGIAVLAHARESNRLGLGDPNGKLGAARIFREANKVFHRDVCDVGTV